MCQRSHIRIQFLLLRLQSLQLLDFLRYFSIVPRFLQVGFRLFESGSFVLDVGCVVLDLCV
jgi:hypothetical protein